MQTQIIKSLSQISQDYDAIYCDIWGVIHNGRAQFTPALNALRQFRAEKKPVILISNSPRPSSQIPAQLMALDIFDDCYDAIVTSGDATIHAANAIGNKAYRIGPPKDDGFFNSLDAKFVNIDEAQYIICTGPRDDLNEQAEDYRAELSQLLTHGLPFICANPDKIVQYGGRLIPCGGALADIYEELGGNVIMAGKPFSPIYDMVDDECQKILGQLPPKSRILCIGDGLNTDVKGANLRGLDCLFVADGIHANDMKDANGLSAEKTASFLENSGLVSKFAIEFLE